MTLAATFILSLAPQIFPGGDLKLPPRKPSVVETQAAQPVNELEQFRRDLLQMSGPDVKVEAKLEEMGRSYARIEALILEVARTARAGEMKRLMPVARRYGRVSGTARVADELLFQLLARRLGDATRVVVETMAALKGAGAKPALKQCVRAPIPAVRRQAVAVLAPLCTADDVPFAVTLAGESSLDLRLRAVDLLGRIGGSVALERLVGLLSEDPAVAAAACRSLIGLGAAAIPALRDSVKVPAADRSCVYAAFALAQIGDVEGRALVPAELRPALIARLQSSDALTRVLAAVPVADLVFTSAGAADEESILRARQLDQELVEALLLVVEPLQFVPNIDLLRSSSEQRLVRHTGRAAASDPRQTWREWWDSNRGGFLGVRAQISVDAENAGSAIVTWREPGRLVRVVGEQMAGRDVPGGAVEVVLSSVEMRALVARLEAGGFGDASATRLEGGLPLVRSIDVRVRDGRSSVAVTERPHLAFDEMTASIEGAVERELWQLYRLPAQEPDREAYWRQERRWLEAHPDEFQRASRFVDRIVRGWDGWDAALRARAIGFMAAHPRRRELLTEARGDAMVAALRALPALQDFDRQLLELAASAAGDRIWRACLELAITAEGGGRDLVKNVFKVIGPDAVLSALTDARPQVRGAAVDEVVATRDARAAPTLIAMLADADLQVQRTAVFACGSLGIESASRPLVDLIVAEQTDAKLRREALRALGRVGGPLAFQVLQKAMQAPARADKEAAMRGLGELREARSAQLLCEFAVVGHDQPFGDLAVFNLQRLGGVLAAPALRKQIPLVQDERIRADLVLLLGLYQAPENVPELMDLLRRPKYAGEAAPRLEGATGVDISNVPDRIAAIESWWRAHKDDPQWRWLLDALREADVPHDLGPANFTTAPGLAAVPELCRLLVDLETPRLWVLTSAVLRSVTGEDFGGVTMQTPPQIREGIAGRYRLLLKTGSATGR